MTINSVFIKNFMNISEANLTFKPGINVLLGVNGSGKSAVLEAIAYCLLDRKKSDSWKDYIKTGTSGFEVNLSVTDDAGELITFDYKGSRSSGSTTKKIEYKGTPYHGADCATFLESKFDSEMLENVVFSLQGSKSITSITPSERRSIFKKIFNSDFTEQSDRIKEALSSETDKQKALESRISALQSKTYPFSRLEVIDEDAYGKLLLEKEALLVRLKEEMEIELKESEYKTKEQEVSSLKKKLSFLLEKLQGIDDEHKKISDIIPNLTKNVNDIYGNINTLLEEKGEFSKSLKELEELSPIDTNKIIEIIKQTEDAIIDVKKNISITETHLLTHKKGICTQCGQETKVTEIPNLERKLDGFKSSLTTLTLTLNENKTTLKVLQDTQAKRIADILSLRNKIESYSGIIQNKRTQKENEEEKISHFNKMLDTLIKDKNLLNPEVSKMNEDIVSLESWLITNKPSVKHGPTTTKDSLTLVDAGLKSIENTRIKNEERKLLNEKLKISQAEDKKSIEESFTQINESKNRAALLTATRTLFDIEIPNYINNKTCSILQSYLNDKFLSVTKEGLQVELQQDKKGINFVYKAEKDSQWLNTKLASGFEEALLTVAFKASVALAYQSGVLILDEPDKTATDESSRKLFESLLSINKGFQQMFVITHKEEAVEFLKDAGAQVYHVNKGVFNIQY